MSLHDCELCGSADAIEVPFARLYTGDQPIHICCGCGFVFIRERRSAREIADSWSGLYDGTYSPRSPAVLARLTYVAETIRQTIRPAGKSVCDIGAGDGSFLEMMRAMCARPFGIEPSSASERMYKLVIPHFVGTIEEFPGGLFDIVTILWTLENCSSCIDMLRAARRMLKPDGHLVVATGSRIKVPFKKPLHCYLGKNPADTHAFRFSANTLHRALNCAGFRLNYMNHYFDSDVLLVIGTPSTPIEPFAFGDHRDSVADFFARWHRDWP